MNKELSIKVIRDPEKIPKQSQRALSKRCGVALGSFHYCLSELLKKGYLKVESFRNAQNKLAYAYILPPLAYASKKSHPGILNRKQAEYDALKQEIKILKEEFEK